MRTRGRSPINLPVRRRRRSESEEEEGLDLISRLPDCVLCSILGLLPIKDSVRTSVLSSGWRHLWKAAPLRLDDRTLRPDKPHPRSRGRSCGSILASLRTHNKLVSRIVNSHYGPIHSLHLSLFLHLILHNKLAQSSVYSLLKSAVKRGIRELSLYFPAYLLYKGTDRQLLFLLRTVSLHRLTLSRCRFPHLVPPSSLANLKELNLHHVILRYDFLQLLLSNKIIGSLESLLLKKLIIQDNSRKKIPLIVVSVSLPRLRKFVWNSEANELIIEDTPNLESLMWGPFSCKVTVRYAPKLELFGSVSMKFDTLQLGDTCFKQQQQHLPPDHGGPVSTVPTMDVQIRPRGMKMLSNIKTLGISISPNSNLDNILPRFLRCFPCLQNLDILICNGNKRGYICLEELWDKQDSFSFLNSLKTITVRCFSGDRSDVEFLRYFVAHGKVLKKITILCPIFISISDEFVETKRQHLCMDKRASSDLELFFFEDRSRIFCDVVLAPCILNMLPEDKTSFLAFTQVHKFFWLALHDG